MQGAIPKRARTARFDQRVDCPLGVSRTGGTANSIIGPRTWITVPQFVLVPMARPRQMAAHSCANVACARSAVAEPLAVSFPAKKR